MRAEKRRPTSFPYIPIRKRPASPPMRFYPSVSPRSRPMRITHSVREPTRWSPCPRTIPSSSRTRAVTWRSSYMVPTCPSPRSTSRETTAKNSQVPVRSVCPKAFRSSRWIQRMPRTGSGFPALTPSHWARPRTSTRNSGLSCLPSGSAKDSPSPSPLPTPGFLPGRRQRISVSSAAPSKGWPR